LIVMTPHIGKLAVALAGFCALSVATAPAQTTSEFDHCVAWAQRQSGYQWASANAPRNAPLRGAAAGAAGGAFLGGVTGGNAGTGAAIGAAFGAVAGGARRREAQTAQQNAQNHFYSALNVCLSQQR
jgi:outer membrane lipoprotein SlyB